jgi:orotate phosphoribosyltransferase
MPAEPESDRPDARARTLAAHLLDIGAVALRPQTPFTWSSGLLSPIYCDNRRTIAHPTVRRAICDGFVAVMEDEGLLPATTAGTATAGIPHAAWLAEAVDQPMAYVRDEPKGHGQGARIEGDVASGAPVVVVEDLISTGGSALDAAAALQAVGAEVKAVLAIFSYELDAAEQAFVEAGIPCHVLTTFRTLLDVARDRDALSDSDRAALQNWRTDPEGWSAARKHTEAA